MADSDDSDEVEVIYVESESSGQPTAVAPPPGVQAPPTQLHDQDQNQFQNQLATLESVASLQANFAERIQGSRRDNDDSSIAFGDKFSERFGGVVRAAALHCVLLAFTWALLSSSHGLLATSLVCLAVVCVQHRVCLV